jgi:hypothetical protein
VSILAFGYASSYIIARPDIKEYKETVYKMLRDGATDEEIEKFMDDHLIVHTASNFVLISI